MTIVGVTVPLLAILVLQYVSLTKLKRASTSDQKLERYKYLEAIADKIGFAYEDRAERLLNCPEKEFLDDSRVADHFEKVKWSGARVVFIVRFKRNGESETLFFNPTTRSLEKQTERAEQPRINSVTASWRMLSQSGAQVQGKKVRVSQLDPETRIFMVPVTDESSRVVGMTGMFLAHEYFKSDYLPRAISHYQSDSSSIRPPADVIVTVRDPFQQLVYSSKPLQEIEDEVSVPMKFVYTDWFLGIQSDGWTPEQWARTSFILALSLSILLTGLLVAALALALRTAAREMRLSQMKSDFVSNVSHELRTPLSSIRVFGEFFRLGWIEDAQKVRECGEYIESESRRLTQLINNILDFSTIESAQKTYEFEKTDLVELIDEALKTFEVPLKQRGIIVVFEDSNTDLPPVLIDREAVTQAFMNLLDNAVKYSGNGNRILIKVWEDNSSLKVSVTDHGIGIPPEEQKLIFEKFYRVGTGLVHDIKGSGLGLAIVDHIVKAHAGDITVESEPGQGSTFVIRLPLSNGTRPRG